MTRKRDFIGIFAVICVVSLVGARVAAAETLAVRLAELLSETSPTSVMKDALVLIDGDRISGVVPCAGLFTSVHIESAVHVEGLASDVCRQR